MDGRSGPHTYLGHRQAGMAAMSNLVVNPDVFPSNRLFFFEKQAVARRAGTDAAAD